MDRAHDTQDSRSVVKSGSFSSPDGSRHPYMYDGSEEGQTNAHTILPAYFRLPFADPTAGDYLTDRHDIPRDADHSADLPASAGQSAGEADSTAEIVS